MGCRQEFLEKVEAAVLKPLVGAVGLGGQVKTLNPLNNDPIAPYVPVILET